MTNAACACSAYKSKDWSRHASDWRFVPRPRYLCAPTFSFRASIASKLTMVPECVCVRRSTQPFV